MKTPNRVRADSARKPDETQASGNRMRLKEVDGITPIPFKDSGIVSDAEALVRPSLVLFEDGENGNAIVDWVMTEEELELMNVAAGRCNQSLSDWVLSAVREKVERSHTDSGSRAA